MAFIKVLGGDFVPGSQATLLFGKLTLKSAQARWLGEQIEISNITSVEQVTSETKAGNGVGRATAGGLLLGPVGAVVGAVTRKQSTEVVFSAEFEDGRRLLGQAPHDVFVKLTAAAFASQSRAVSRAREREISTREDAADHGANPAADVIIARYVSESGQTPPVAAPSPVGSQAMPGRPVFGKRKSA